MDIFFIICIAGYLMMGGYILWQAYLLDRMREELKRNKPPF
jgi:hypothetical protein